MHTPTFAQRLRALATWIDKVDWERRYGTLKVPPSDEVQQDLRTVAAGLDADPTLDDILLDIIARTPSLTEPILEDVEPLGMYQEIVPVPVTMGPVMVSVKVYTEVSSEGVVVQKIARDIAAVRARTGDSVQIDYRIHLQP